MKGRLAPSGQQFLPELLTLARLAVAATEALRDSLGPYHGNVDRAPDIASYVSNSDQVAAAVRTSAAHALVPPVDGDDATDLAWRLRAVLAAVRRVSDASISLRPALPDAGVSHLVDLVMEATESLEGAATTLTDRSRALDFARETQRIAREGERAYTETIGALLAGAPDPLFAVRQAEFYRSLRENLYACARAAAAVQRIALKQYVA